MRVREVTRVALATENNAVDGIIFLEFVRRIGLDVEAWSTTPVPFSGLPGIWKHLPLFLAAAEGDGIDHALVAIDNDGGAKRNPPHETDHVEEQFADNWNAACRTCRLLSTLPPAWSGPARRTCLVVCVQTLETWLLVMRGHKFRNRARRPESDYGRLELKRTFWGDDLSAGDERRLGIVRSLLNRPGAMDLLEPQPSFRAFKEQIESWR